jgi:hypothetical protein
MLQTISAIIEPDGRITLLEPVALRGPCRALVTILDVDSDNGNESALLSEGALSDWNRPEEDAAWAHLQPGK